MNQTSGCRFDEESHALGAHFRDESMAERLLQGQIAEVIELRRVSVRFDNGRLLLGREAGGLQSSGLKAKAK